MHHVVFYEPRFIERQYDIWAIRGGYKYKSILGDLGKRARLTLLMSRLPPEGDPHRTALETEFGVDFAEFQSDEQPHPLFAAELTNSLTKALERLKPTILSNLNGRGIGFCHASAVAAHRLGLTHVMRLGGNDLESRGEKAERLQTAFWGTRHYFEHLVQERVASHLASRIIVMSRREHARLASMTEDPAKVHVCFRGVDQSHFHPGSGEAKSACRRFLFVGRRSLEKGYDILEEACEALAARGSPVTVTFAGTFEPAEVANRTYVGFVDHADLPALYRRHDALIVPSRSEGFPQVIMEAMSCGLPCILSRGVFRSDFVDGRDCLLADATPSAMAEAMERLAGDDDLYRRLAASSLELARQEFSEAHNRARYHDILLAD
jgi:glycosyltransferase involved in cell wall biosynthesis